MKQIHCSFNSQHPYIVIAMEKAHTGTTREAVIVNELGLHARSAAKLAKLAMAASGPIWIEKNGEQVNASSMIDILTLACPKGTMIKIVVEDPSDIETLESMEQLVKNGFGE